MGRKIKNNSCKQETDYWIASWKAVKNDPLQLGSPTDSKLLRFIVEVLLIRLGSFNRDLTNSARLIIHEMAAQEKYCEMRADFLNEVAEIHDHFKLMNQVRLGALGFYKPGKETHSEIQIKLQRIMLKEFFDEHQFPGTAKNVFTKKVWLQKHEPEILTLLRLIPCKCNYADSLEDFFKQDHVNPRCKTEGQWLDRILAIFHHTTPDNIKKLLKKAHQTEAVVEKFWMKQYELQDFLATATPAERQVFFEQYGFSSSC